MIKNIPPSTPGAAGDANPTSGPRLQQPPFLPAARDEMDRLGWDRLDVLIISGDAHVDHPAFGPALLGRLLVARGYRVGIVAQPGLAGPDDISSMGRPRLFAGVTAGALDSMLAHYTAFRKKRSDDAYTPGGKAGPRPNRAVLAYTSLARNAFPGLPVVIGGIEASLRRISHYDFWTDKIRRPVLADAKADLLAYGMAERALVEIARRLDDLDRAEANAAEAASEGEGADAARGGAKWLKARAGVLKKALVGIAGTAVIVADPAEALPPGADVIELPSHEAVESDPARLMEATLALELKAHRGTRWVAQKVGGRTLVIAPPAAPLDTAEMDELYGLPFSREAHPSCGGEVPALEMLRTSVTSHRGCGGGCSFCSLALHQGRAVSSRSAGSIEEEVRAMAAAPWFRGSVSDVGGPSANMWGARCLQEPGRCARRSCLVPSVCDKLELDQAAQIGLLRRLARIGGVKNVRVASGVRHDLALRDQAYLDGLVGEFTGGQLKVAPEHCAAGALRLMRKPGWKSFEDFLKAFGRLSRQAGKEQYVVPYFISAFPGCGEKEMRELRDWLGQRNWRPRQTQCFIPTPGTVATAMFHAGVDERGKAIKVAKTDAERIALHKSLAGDASEGGARAGSEPRGGRARPGKPARGRSRGNWGGRK